MNAGNGRGGNVDFGRRSVDDHDARKSRVGATIVASCAGLLSELSAEDIFRSSSFLGDAAEMFRLRANSDRRAGFTDSFSLG